MIVLCWLASDGKFLEFMLFLQPSCFAPTLTMKNVQRQFLLGCYLLSNEETNRPAQHSVKTLFRIIFFGKNKLQLFKFNVTLE